MISMNCRLDQCYKKRTSKGPKEKEGQWGWVGMEGEGMSQGHWGEKGKGGRRWVLREYGDGNEDKASTTQG